MSNDLTIFALPKAMRGTTAIQQRNSIKSWLMLEPRPNIILLGDEYGVADLARELKLEWHPQIACTKYGTPRVDDIFRMGEEHSSSRVLAYVNADIILMNDFVKAVQAVQKSFKDFLMVGRRWNLDLEEELDFNSSSWREDLRSMLRQRGFLYPPGGMDYFVFSRGLYPEMPAFGIGRTAWDCWLVRSPMVRDIAVIDATPSVLSIHHNHDYSHVKDHDKKAFIAWTGEEGKLNQELAGKDYGEGNLNNVQLELRDFVVTQRNALYDEAEFYKLLRESMAQGMAQVFKCYLANQINAAMHHLEKCCELNIAFPKFYKVLALIQSKMGQHAEANESIIQEIKSFPAQPGARSLLQNFAPEKIATQEFLDETLPDLHISELRAVECCLELAKKPLTLLDCSDKQQAQGLMRYCPPASTYTALTQSSGPLSAEYDFVFINSDCAASSIAEAWRRLGSDGALMISTKDKKLSDFDLPEHCLLVFFENQRLMYSEFIWGGLYFLTRSQEFCERLANTLSLRFPECSVTRRFTPFSNIRKSVHELSFDRALLDQYQI